MVKFTVVAKRNERKKIIIFSSGIQVKILKFRNLSLQVIFVLEELTINALFNCRK
jgi:hypothetical protein